MRGASIFRTSTSDQANHILSRLLGSAARQSTVGLVCRQCRAHALPAIRHPVRPTSAFRFSNLHRKRFYSTPSEPQKQASERSHEPAEPLPSAHEEQRWEPTKHLSRIMDEVQAKVVLYTQRVNSYTGTDYSGIEELRRDIKAMESLVKERLHGVRTAKEAVDHAHAQQASAQKEVVGLLERKHSWSAADLERYMSLIRSEHVNDHAIQTAKDDLAAAERALEEVRTRLEKRERQQYHEEQIWSDTIRRNSTWVTIGLMGVNIALLLSNVAIIEPWRRRRLVREIKSVLAEQAEAQPAVVAAEAMAVPVEGPAPVEAAAAVEAIVAAEAVAPETVDAPQGAATPVDIASIEKELEELPVEALDESEPASPAFPLADHPWVARARDVAEDLVSDRPVSVRMIDQTVLAIEGAAVGAMFMAVMLFLVRPS